MFAEVTIAESVGQMQKQGERGESRHDSGIAETEPRSSLTLIGQGGLGEPLYAGFGQYAIFRDAFDFKKTTNGVTGNLFQIREVLQTFVDAEVLGVVDRAFGTGGTVFLEVLLDVGGLVFHMQTRRDPTGDNTRAETSGGALYDLAVEQELDTIRATKVNVFTDNRLKELTPTHRTIEDLCAGELTLPAGLHPVPDLLTSVVR